MNQNPQMCCGNCGKLFGDGEKYCRRCGTKAGEGTFKPKKNMSIQILYGPMPVEQVHRCKNCGHVWTMYGKEHCPECGKEANGLNWNDTNPAYCRFMEVVDAANDLKKAFKTFQDAGNAFNAAADIMESRLDFPENETFMIQHSSGSHWFRAILALAEKMNILADNFIRVYSNIDDSEDEM